MCTAAVYKTKDFYFGRNLDYEFPYGEEVTITPRNYPFSFRFQGEMKQHYAMIGMAHVADDYPLYYDAMNEKGVCIAGLNFVGNAVYNNPIEGKENVAQFELIAWILCQCENMNDVRNLLEKINITNTPFSDKFCYSPWPNSTARKVRKMMRQSTRKLRSLTYFTSNAIHSSKLSWLRCGAICQ